MECGSFGISDFGLKKVICRPEIRFEVHNPHSAFPNPKSSCSITPLITVLDMELDVDYHQSQRLI